jgi:hypothetical protein
VVACILKRRCITGVVAEALGAWKSNGDKSSSRTSDDDALIVVHGLREQSRYNEFWTYVSILEIIGQRANQGR